MVAFGDSDRTVLILRDRVRYALDVTAFPAGITTGSTWDTSLMYARGNALGNDNL